MKRFKIKKSGIKDKKTGLIWSKEKHPSMNWKEAIQYCGSLNENGKSDWRLPTVNELESIIDRGNYNPAITDELKAFSSVVSGSYWASTTYVNSTSYAWFVNLYNGYVFGVNKTNNYYVWPVRGEMK